MIAPFRHLLRERTEKRSALGAFTCYDATTAFGIILAAESRDAPVVLLLSESSYRARDGPLLLAALVAIATKARIPCCVELDHVSDIALISEALDGGAGAVMADGSRLPLEQNIELVREARSVAARHEADVEAELGHVAGDENVATAAAAGQFTDPDEAARFVAQASAACLAVSVGNVHGVYARPPRLDWDLLEAIAARTRIPLSLHGASGLSDGDLMRAIELGVRKVNINTELRQSIYAELEHHVPETRRGYRLLDLNRALVDATAAAANRKLAVFSAR